MLRHLYLLPMVLVIFFGSFAIGQSPPPRPEPTPPTADTLADPSDAAGLQARRHDEFNLSRLFAQSPDLHSIGGPLDLLRYESIVRELELSVQQQSQLAAARVELIRRRQTRARQRQKDRPGPQAMTPREPDVIEDQLREDQKTLSDVLTDTQRSRLSQLHLQWRIESIGMLAVLLDPQMALELGMDNDDQTRLKRVADDAAAEFKDKVRELKREYEQQILNELSPDSASRLRQLLGPEMNKR